MTRCTICGRSHYDSFAFKGGHICEVCLRYIQDDLQDNDSVSDEEH